MSAEANKTIVLRFFEHFSAGKVEAESHGETARGKLYHNQYHFLFEIRGGQIQAVREYLDTMHAKEVLVDQ